MSEPSAPHFRLNTGEIITREELIRRVTERVYQLWLDDLRRARERGAATTPAIRRTWHGRS
ncbi:MAG: hypothetical protein SF162_08970 [bacterium]|nr:hypothetical protein [bacterium]